MRRRMIEFLVLLTIALGAGPVGAAFWQWSQTPGTNASADPTINWREGMAPSAVNDSARAMMAALASFRDDNNGSLVTAGTATALTLTANQTFSSVTDLANQTLTFVMSVTNGANATLNVSGIGAHPLLTAFGAPVPSGSMVAGRIYTATFINSGVNTSFKVHGNFEDAYNIPLGGLLWSTLASPPNSSFVAPSGQCISTTTYATYWAAVGSPASGICPGGQFQILDMRGRVAAALDTMNGVAASRLTSASSGCGAAMTAVGSVCATGESKTLVTANLPPYSPSGTITNGAISFTNVTYSSIVNGGQNAISSSTTGSAGGNFTTSLNASQASSSFTGSAQGGSSAAFSSVQPTVGLMAYLRIL